LAFAFLALTGLRFGTAGALLVAGVGVACTGAGGGVELTGAGDEELELL